MATLKIKKSPHTPSSPSETRSPVRGVGAGVRPRPTLAQAQAERERRDKEREERWQEQLRQRFGNQAPPRFGQQREGNATAPANARSRPPQRPDGAGAFDRPRRDPRPDNRQPGGHAPQGDPRRNAPRDARGQPAHHDPRRGPPRDDVRHGRDAGRHDPRNDRYGGPGNAPRQAPRDGGRDAFVQHGGHQAFDRSPRDTRSAPPRHDAFQTRPADPRGGDPRNARRPDNRAFEGQRSAPRPVFDPRRPRAAQPPKGPPRERLSPAQPARGRQDDRRPFHRDDEDDFDTREKPTLQGSMRLSKRMSELGIASRREADEWIEKGWVRVDGRVVSELGSRVLPEQQITVDAKAKFQQAQKVTVIVNKPVGYVSGQAEDGYEPALVLVTPDNQWREDQSGTRFLRDHTRSLVPAGRLDIDSVGLLVLTQDGRVAKQLIGEDSDVEKEYLVRVASPEGQTLSDESLALLNHGLELDGEPLREARVEWVNEDQLRFVLKEGKKRQIRRMCEGVGLQVLGLKRVRIGKVMLGDLPPGQWRYLRADETFV